MRLWPRSLAGQLIATGGIALLLAHLLAAFLLVRAAEERQAEDLANAAALRLVPALSDETMMQRRFGRERRFGRIMQRVSVPDYAALPGDRPLPEIGERLETILQDEGIAIDRLVVTSRSARSDPMVRAMLGQSSPERQARWGERQVLVAALKPAGADEWRVVRVPIRPDRRGLPAAMWLQLGLAFLVLAIGQYVVLRRITRPLAALKGRMEDFSARQATDGQLAPSGPHDVASLIEAHNAMERRVVGLLDEKDMMLGAIGHDLKTPLAGLRVRIESVTDDTARAKMAAQIEEMALMLDDILSLARIGRAQEERESIDLAALLETVVSEYEDRGEPVTLAEANRTVLPAREIWLRRAMRNLIDNALRYAGKAQVSLSTDAGGIVIAVTDDGPGIPPENIAAMLEPFVRGEVSRNRATGGAGLGLTIARAIAEQHGGTLSLANRKGGGLTAAIHLPH
ncbi:sensor histidine kinase [Altererythrobacter sp. CAU 1778]